MAQDEMKKYGRDSLFTPLFQYMQNKEVDSAFAFLDSINIETHGLPYYKAAQLIKLDIKFDVGSWDMSIANDIQNLLPYWEADSLNLLNMYAIVCKKNGELEEARKTFEFCYQKREDPIFLCNIMGMNNLENRTEENLQYESKIVKDSLNRGYYMLGSTYLKLGKNKKAFDFYALHLESSPSKFREPETCLKLIEIIQQENYKVDACEYYKLLPQYFDSLSPYELNRDKEFIADMRKKYESIDLDCE